MHLFALEVVASGPCRKDVVDALVCMVYGRLAYNYFTLHVNIFLVRMKNMQVNISSPTKARGSRLEARISNEQKALYG